MAATLILVAAAAMWLLGPPTEDRGAVAENRPSTPPRPAPSAEAPPPTPPVNAPPRPPRIVAMSLSPATVRSAGDGAVLSVPPGTDIVTLHLEAGGDRRPLGDARATVRAVAGDEVWQGAPVVDTTLPAGVAARVDVPASRLPVDDYIVTLFSAAAGTEQERAQYFLRVRPQ